MLYHASQLLLRSVRHTPLHRQLLRYRDFVMFYYASKLIYKPPLVLLDGMYTVGWIIEW